MSQSYHSFILSPISHPFLPAISPKPPPLPFSYLPSLSLSYLSIPPIIPPPPSSLLPYPLPHEKDNSKLSLIISLLADQINLQTPEAEECRLGRVEEAAFWTVPGDFVGACADGWHFLEFWGLI